MSFLHRPRFALAALASLSLALAACGDGAIDVSSPGEDGAGASAAAGSTDATDATDATDPANTIGGTATADDSLASEFDLRDPDPFAVEAAPGSLVTILSSGGAASCVVTSDTVLTCDAGDDSAWTDDDGSPAEHAEIDFAARTITAIDSRPEWDGQNSLSNGTYTFAGYNAVSDSSANGRILHLGCDNSVTFGAGGIAFD